jgi:putative aldouronate transport system permease protein
MKSDNITKFIIYSTLFIVTVITIFPFLNLIALSLSDSNRIVDLTGLSIFPKGFSFDTYKALLLNDKVLIGLMNSALITIVGTVINVIFTSMTAYALAQPKLVGRKLIMTFIIITMVFEPGIIPDFLVMKNLGLLNSYWSVFLYKGINVFYLMVLIRYFEEIPQALIESAQIDGANHIQILFKIVIPLSTPAIAMIALAYGVFHWNEYFRAMIYLSDPDKWPLQVVLRQFVVDGDKAAMVGLQQMANYSDAAQISIKALKAGIIILTVVPVLMVYPFVLKYFTKGTMSGSVKE